MSDARVMEKAKELVTNWLEDFDISDEERRFVGLEVRIAAALLKAYKKGRRRRKVDRSIFHKESCLDCGKLIDVSNDNKSCFVNCDDCERLYREG